MNYTENYHLPQWEETDRIMRTDFNQMCADMEAGLKENAQDAAAAQSTADSALSKANKAYSPSYQPYVTGSYTGAGPTTPQTINVGFKPRLLIISGQKINTDATIKFSALIGDGILSDAVTLTSTGFTIKTQDNIENAPINEWKVFYRYFAFR